MRCLQQGLIWGKEGKYFTDLKYIQAAAAVAPLHATVKSDGGLISGGGWPCNAELSLADNVRLPINVTNHAVLEREEYHQMLWESKFLLGLGGRRTPKLPR